MSQPIEAVFEHGVLRPLAPLDLQEHEVVFVSIEKGARANAVGSTPNMAPEQKQAIVALLDQMEQMPDKSPPDSLSQRDHDQIIYGLKK